MPICDGDSRGVLPQPPPTYMMIGLLWTYANALTLPEPICGPFGPTAIHLMLASAVAYDDTTKRAQTAIITALKRITRLLKDSSGASVSSLAR